MIKPEHKEVFKQFCYNMRDAVPFKGIVWEEYRDKWVKMVECKHTNYFAYKPEMGNTLECKDCGAQYSESETIKALSSIAEGETL